MDRSTERECFHFSWTLREEQELQRRELIESFLGKLALLPLRCVPQPQETLASLLSRTARKMRYEYPRWLLRPEQIPLLTIDPASLPLLERATDYRYLSRLLLLEEEQLYALTLHRFASRFARPFPYLAPQQTGTRQLLSYEQRTQYFDSSRRLCEMASQGAQACLPCSLAVSVALASRLSMRRIMAMEIQASSLLGSTS